MALSKQPCKNHPDKFTSRKCFYCKEPICIDCCQNYFHHIFCSLKCAIKWRITDLLSVFKTSKEFVWLVVIILLSNIIMYNLIVNKFEQPQQESNIMQDSMAVYPAPEGFIIDSLRNAVQGKFKIDVQAQPGMVLTLSHNGVFVESLLPQNEGFSFEDVVLKNGKNTFTIWGLTGKGKSMLVDSFSIVYEAPRLDYLLKPVYRVRTSEKIVAFTFDGGSSNKGTQQILDILRDQGLKCTIFLTGQFIENYPDLVRQIIADGHEIANHSYNHPHFTNLEINGQNTTRNKINRAFLEHQLNITDSLFYLKFKMRMKPLWRAPYGEINREILFWAAELGYRHIGWSYRCDSWDWVADRSSQLYRSAAEIKKHFLDIEKKNGLNGKIILMHLGSERQDDFPYSTLASLITELKSRGYTFLQVSQLLKG
jgi:peptidoglycan/xylan/chitin deacetylase (PgdA/CDA1 family)